MGTEHQPYTTMGRTCLFATFEVDGSDVLSAPVPWGDDAVTFLYLKAWDIAIDHGVPIEFVTIRFSEKEVTSPWFVTIWSANTEATPPESEV